MSLIHLILKLFNRGPFAVTKAQRKAAQTRCPPGWRWVSTADRWGRVLDEQWSFEPPPTRYEKNGFDQFPTYIDRMLATKNWFATLSAFPVDDEEAHGISLWIQEGQVTINEFFPGPRMTEEEKKARELVDNLELSVHEEYRAADSTLIISWNLPSDPAAILEVAKRFATEVRGIPIDAGLKISYDEPEDERDRYQDVCQVTISSTYPIEDPTAPPPIAPEVDVA